MLWNVSKIMTDVTFFGFFSLYFRLISVYTGGGKAQAAALVINAAGEAFLDVMRNIDEEE